MSNLNLDKFVDRETEQCLFEEMLKFNDDARLLAIEDGSGAGKSELLRKFKHRCRVVRKLPVSLVALEQLGDKSAWAVVQQVIKDLQAHPFNLSFPTFEKYKNNFQSMFGLVNLDRANLQEAHDFSVDGIRIEYAEHITLDLNPESIDQEKCIKAFLTDLAEICQRQPVILLFDTYNEIETYSHLIDWLLNHLLASHCFDRSSRPPQLLFVMAGRQLPCFTDHYDEAACQAVIKKVSALSKWTREHVKTWLDLNNKVYKGASEL